MRAFLFSCCLLAGFVAPINAKIMSEDAYTFSLEQSVLIEASRETVWAAFTGDVSGWWDHSFSGAPKSFVLEAKPGGSFLEIFDEAGNGVEHARVTYVKAPERLHFEGPLPFNGMAMRMSHIVTLTTTDNGSTEVRVQVSAIGKLEENWAEAVDGVWHHFLAERLQPFVEETLE